MRNDKIKGTTIAIAGGGFEEFELSVAACKLPCKKTPKVSGKY